jgi:pimeloyl-ACP methyl ester carboxylesterase
MSDTAVTDGWLTVGDNRLHYLEAGDGPPLLLLHGGIIDAAACSWGEVIEPLASDFRVVALDLLGYGRSDAPDARYATTDHVDVVADAVAELDLAPLSVVGLSLGGGVALGYALAYPDRVRRLVLVDSYGLGRELPNGRLSWLLAKVSVLNRLSVALLCRSRGFTTASLGNVAHDPDALSPAAIDCVHELACQPDAGKAFRRWRSHEVTRDGYRTVYVDDLPELSVPTLLLHGREDEVFPVAWAERAAERIPDAELVVLDECAHWPPREYPDRFVTEVTAFLTD